MASRLHLLGSAPEPPAGIPAWAAKGFRPFFLLAGGFAALILPLWLLALAGSIQLDAYLGAMYWHAHEMVFGFTAAVIAGFLLTAAGNWTGRETATGGSLMARVALGHSGRPLVPPRSIALAFGALTAAAALRVLGPFARSAYPLAIYASGALWTLAFAAFTARYAPILVRPRADGRPG